MIVIHVARKPLIGSVAKNVLEYGTGGLNIDGCRIGSDDVGWGGAGGGLKNWDERKGDGMKAGDPRPVKGRWPANLILEHDPRCVFHGKRKVTTGLPGVAEIEQYQEIWDCVDGCPAKEINEQRGSSDYFLGVQSKPTQND